MMSSRASTVLGGLGYLESPRWHDGELWFSDFFSRRIYSVSPFGELTVRAYVSGQPSGLGFLADGTALVVSMHDRRLLSFVAGQSPRHVASTWQIYDGQLNDMYVDAFGRAYVSAFPSRPGSSRQTVEPLLMVVGSSVRRVAENLANPNGIASSADGKLLIVAETAARRLTAFDIADDGSLSGRRLFADLGGREPDGLCVDAEGAVWVGCVFAEEFVRVAEGGEILDVVSTPGRWAVAPALGGQDGRTLYCLTARTSLLDFSRGQGEGSVESVRVDVPGLV